MAENILRKNGAIPSFLGYSIGGTPFPSSICVSINEELVHGFGNRNIVLREGDIVGLDMGCEYNGRFTDMAVTVPVGKISEDVRELLDVTRLSLKNGISVARAGIALQKISEAVEKTILPHGFGVVRSYVGHGVGHHVHEEPQVPNFVSKNFSNPKLKEGMVLALEPMVTIGNEEVEVLDDEWTVATVDGSYSAHFEQTILITKDGAEILTPFDGI
jgi:methionyl aminopeptidase